MRIEKIEIGGVSYPLCYSVRVLMRIQEEYGSMEAFSRALFPDEIMESLPDRMWLLSEEMKAGARYAQRQGENPPTPLTAEEIMDSVSGSEAATLMNLAIQVVNSSSETSIEAEPRKNGEATQGG